MALTYYIRSWDPRSTYPTNPQEGDICYTITLDQTWAPVGGVKKDNIVKEEIYQNGAWVEQGGGGGGGATFYVPTQEITIDDSGASVPVSDVSIDGLSVGDHVALKLELIEDEETYYGDGIFSQQSLGQINLTTISCAVSTNHTSIAYDVNFEIIEGRTPGVTVENHSSHTPAEGIYNITVFSI